MSYQTRSRILIAFLWALTIVLSLMAARQTVESQQESILDRKTKDLLPTGDEIIRDSENMGVRNKNLSLTFVGGMPRSGTTLMRTMLDAHPDIRCGQETRVIPSILTQRSQWLKSPLERRRLEEAGVLPLALDEAVTQFILEIIINHGKKSKYYCDKDPYDLMYTDFLHGVFPNAKFILMLRDGRATAHSVVTRGVTITGMDIRSYRDVLSKWSSQIAQMYKKCLDVGPDFCLCVHYEQLVLQPVYNTHRIFDFLGIPWNEAVLHHEKHLNETKLSATEISTEQVKKPLYLDALTSWFGQIPPDVERDMAQIAPMLSVLGYDPFNPTPKYGEPDDFVLGKIFQKNSAASK